MNIYNSISNDESSFEPLKIRMLRHTVESNQKSHITSCDLSSKYYTKLPDNIFHNYSCLTELSLVGNYTGLTSVGSMEIDSASYRGNEVPEIVSDNRFLYEGFFTIEVKMPKL